MKKIAILLTSCMAAISVSAIGETKALRLSPDFCVSAFRSLMSGSALALDIKPTNSSDTEVAVIMHYQNGENFPEDSVGKCKLVDGNIVIFPPEVTYKYNR
ncbi:hypothetical protein F153LOC_12480 [Lelliottia sp. F153]|jgi:hypothetical protein|uniref:hypothetical protein n=1 Tax=unclassified Lelliottia TaxID=2642424 RepID=UPI000C7E9C84|nr:MULTISPECIES: hypothetical protein [unclassified Lelliottia]PLY47261.1 hypothetical protein F159LOC_04730 [Lelliottia sp. F159]PLY54325.1 hypothetical protein F153LOC_12480 [Lelliottia sp. F153]